MLEIAPQGDTPTLEVEHTGNTLTFLNAPPTITLTGTVSGSDVTIYQNQVLPDEETSSTYEATIRLDSATIKGKNASGNLIVEGTYTGFGYLTYQSGSDQFGNPIIVTDNCTWFGNVTGYIVPSIDVPAEGSLSYDLGVKRIEMSVVEKESEEAMEAEFDQLVLDLEGVNDPSIRKEEGKESKENILVIRKDARHGVEEILEQGRQRWRDRTLRGRPDQIDRVAWTGFVNAVASLLKDIQNAWLEIKENIDEVVKNPPEQPAPGNITSFKPIHFTVGNQGTHGSHTVTASGGISYILPNSAQFDFGVIILDTAWDFHPECLPLSVYYEADMRIYRRNGTFTTGNTSNVHVDNWVPPGTNVGVMTDVTPPVLVTGINVYIDLNGLVIPHDAVRAEVVVTITIVDKCANLYHALNHYPITLPRLPDLFHPDPPITSIVGTDDFDTTGVTSPFKVFVTGESLYRVQLYSPIGEEDPKCRPITFDLTISIQAVFFDILAPGYVVREIFHDEDVSAQTNNFTWGTSFSFSDADVKQWYQDFLDDRSNVGNYKVEHADEIEYIVIEFKLVVSSACDTETFIYRYTPKVN
ncbi:MAG: hypothetical protein NUW37_08485 [Planctomycetes bacterium]|nr:hypothetical protein [Planctomycetota bacterium]